METALLVLRVVLSLGLVLGVMWIVARRLGRRPAQARGVAVDVLGRRSLGRRAGIAVVEVDGRRLVLGVSDTGVRLVADLGVVPAEPAPVVRAVPAPRPARVPHRDFAAVLAAQDGADDGTRPAVTRPVVVPAAASPRASAARRVPPPVTDTPRSTGRRPAHRGEPVPARRAAARVVASSRPPGSPITGSVLDRATWSRARAVLTGRIAAP